MAYQYNHGFCIIRCQPYHIGHDRLVQKMMEQCAHGTVVIGSAQESGTDKNPLPYFIRKKMVLNVYRETDAYSRLWIMGVKDAPHVPWDEWVLNALSKEQPDLPAPDVMYVGDEKEYQLFKNKVPHVEICSRTTQDFPFLSGNMVRDMVTLKDERWKQFTHPQNHALIEKSFEDIT